MLLPILRAPLYHSFNPRVHAAHGAFRLFPAELTMLNDLAAFTRPAMAPEATRRTSRRHSVLTIESASFRAIPA